MEHRTVTVTGTDGPIRIERDRWGIPHVRATTIADLFFGQGYATATDRTWHLEWDRRRAAGTLAEVTGQAAHAVTDAFARRARLLDVADAGYAALDGEGRSMLDAHAAGINAALTASPARPVAELAALGIDAGVWRPADSVAAFQIRHVVFATWQTKLWRARLLAALGPAALTRFRQEGTSGETPLIVPSGVRAAVGALADSGLLDDVAGAGGASAHPDLAGVAALAPLGLQLSGSNCWAVHGSRTADGHPIVVGDPHRAYEVPNVYYQIRLSCPDEGIEAAGFAFPGVPGIQHFGQNRDVCWGVTNAMADYQDVFVERLPDAVIDRREETVRVAGGADRPVECLLTRHGPVVVGGSEHGVGVALASTGLRDPAGSLQVLPGLLRARTIDELDALLAGWVEPLNNWVMADRHGDIAYRTTGTVPRRAAINQWLPVPGWDTTDDAPGDAPDDAPDDGSPASGGHDWVGDIPDAELPRERNPSIGAIVTANQRVTTREHRHQLSPDCAGPSRAQRIWDRLGDRRDLDRAALAAIAGDAVSLAGRRFAALVPHPLLADWDGSMDRTSAAAALYASARDRLVRRMTELLPDALRTNPFALWEPPATALGAAQRVDAALDGWIAADDTSLLPDGRSWAAEAADAATAAEVALRAAQGDDPAAWRWGAAHQVTPLHPLRNVLGDQVRPTSGPISGASGCVMATNQVGGMTTDALTGSVARYLWDPVEPANSGWVVPLGASGRPDDAHFADQTGAYVAVELLPVVSPPADVLELRPATTAT